MAEIVWKERADLDAEALERARENALRRIDAEAEAERQRYVTPGSGQAMEYQETAAEALACQDDDNPDPADYPMLVAEQEALAEVGVTVTLHEVAAQVLAERAGWGAIGAAIKRVRRALKMQVEAATSAAQIEALFPIDWPDTD